MKMNDDCLKGTRRIIQLATAVYVKNRTHYRSEILLLNACLCSTAACNSDIKYNQPSKIVGIINDDEMVY